MKELYKVLTFGPISPKQWSWFECGTFSSREEAEAFVSGECEERGFKASDFQIKKA